MRPRLASLIGTLAAAALALAAAQAAPSPKGEKPHPEKPKQHGTVKPHRLNSAEARQLRRLGQKIYARENCFACHGGYGYGGVGPRFRNDIALSLTGHVIKQIMIGRGVMPAFQHKLSNREIAAVATYIRTSWGNRYGPVKIAQVAKIRQQLNKKSETGSNTSGKSGQQNPGKKGGSKKSAGKNGATTKSSGKNGSGKKNSGKDSSGTKNSGKHRAGDSNSTSAAQGNKQ